MAYFPTSALSESGYGSEVYNLTLSRIYSAPRIVFMNMISVSIGMEIVKENIETGRHKSIK